MFLDQVRIEVESGKGGNGMVAWRREKYVAFGGPAGGDGGNGGDVYLQASHNLQTLIDFRFKTQFKAQDGEKGASKNCHGKGGQDLVIEVPCGTVVKDLETGWILADLTTPGVPVLVAQGGRGGRGNSRFCSTRQKAPHFAEPGEPPVTRTLQLELKTLADVGLVGLPNAGKSTLISVISAAKPKIASYPFTTLVPNLGVIKKPNGDGLVVADIPGLIEGASEGVGLGHAFLRHVERTRLLLHLVDVTAADGGTPWDNFTVVEAELTRYSPELAQRPRAVILTKTDSLEDEDLKGLIVQFEAGLKEQGKDWKLFCISSIARLGLTELVNWMIETVDNLPPVALQLPVVAEDTAARANDDTSFEISQPEPGVFAVTGGKIARWLEITDLTNPSSAQRLMDVVKAIGVFTALKKAGAQPGCTIYIEEQPFEYQPVAEGAGSRRQKRALEKLKAQQETEAYYLSEFLEDANEDSEALLEDDLLYDEDEDEDLDSDLEVVYVRG